LTNLRVLVIIPTYNEAENLPTIVDRVHTANPGVHVLVADDNSPDGTGKLADELAESDERVKVLHRAGKEGLGKAYLAGFAWGIEQGYDVICEMDADGSHRPEDFPALLKALVDKKADLVLGSRYVPGGKTVGGYTFQVDLAWRTVRAGLKVVEVPITFVERELGASKMSTNIVAEALWRTTVWGMQYRLNRLLGRR
jgi:dolichol-phosphate mannosyltransferase